MPSKKSRFFLFFSLLIVREGWLSLEMKRRWTALLDYIVFRWHMLRWFLTIWRWRSWQICKGNSSPQVEEVELSYQYLFSSYCTFWRQPTPGWLCSFEAATEVLHFFSLTVIYVNWDRSTVVSDLTGLAYSKFCLFQRWLWDPNVALTHSSLQSWLLWFKITWYNDELSFV